MNKFDDDKEKQDLDSVSEKKDEVNNASAIRDKPVEILWFDSLMLRRRKFS